MHAIGWCGFWVPLLIRYFPTGKRKAVSDKDVTVLQCIYLSESSWFLSQNYLKNCFRGVVTKEANIHWIFTFECLYFFFPDQNNFCGHWKLGQSSYRDRTRKIKFLKVMYTKITHWLKTFIKFLAAKSPIGVQVTTDKRDCGQKISRRNFLTLKSSHDRVFLWRSILWRNFPRQIFLRRKFLSLGMAHSQFQHGNLLNILWNSQSQFITGHTTCENWTFPFVQPKALYQI